MRKHSLLSGFLALLLLLSGCGYLTPQDTAAIAQVTRSAPTPAPAMETSAQTTAPTETSPAPDETPALLEGKGKEKYPVTALSYSNEAQESGLLQGGAATTYVGLGYNVLESTYINPSGFTLGRHILREDAVKSRIKQANAPSQSSYTIMGETVKAYTEDLSAKLKLKSSYPMFSGSIESEFDKSQTQKSNVYFIKSMSGYPKYSEYIDITNDLKDILDPTFEGDLNGTMSAEDLFDNYGTHLVVEALMGARCTYNYTYTSTSTLTTTQMRAKVDASYRFISGSASVDDKKTASEFLSNSVFQSVLTGGKDVDASTLDNLLKNFPVWVESLAGATPTIYGISNMNSLIPIWTFAKDPDRAKLLQDYYNSRGRDIQTLINNMSVIPAPPPQPGTYIQSIVITSDKKESVAKDGSSYPGYKRINKDLNKDAGGDYIYIWYDTTNDPNKALRDIRFSYNNFGGIPSTYVKNPHDLNQEAGGEYIYLWTTTSADAGEPIKAIDIFYGEKADMPTGYTVARYDNTKDAAELNQGAGGAYIYLGIKR